MLYFTTLSGRYIARIQHQTSPETIARFPELGRDDSVDQLPYLAAHVRFCIGGQEGSYLLHSLACHLEGPAVLHAAACETDLGIAETVSVAWKQGARGFVAPDGSRWAPLGGNVYNAWIGLAGDPNM
jgi:hypothetical protein